MRCFLVQQLDDDSIRQTQTRGAPQVGGSDGTAANVDSGPVFDIVGGAVASEKSALARGHPDLRRRLGGVGLLRFLGGRHGAERQRQKNAQERQKRGPTKVHPGARRRAEMVLADMPTV